ncbi:MAG: Na+/H+ antiporter NhaC [Nannocystaceae bacterium]
MSHPTDPDASSATSPAGPDEAPATSTRPISAGWALVPIVTLIATLATVILILPSYEEGFEGTGHLPLIISGSVAALIARWHGWRWPLIKDGVLHAIHLSMGAILILIVIGMLMGTWLISGIVPALIDWGLMLLRPSYFLPATCAVCSVVSVVSGSSWSTAGTIGLALIGVGEVMGVPTAYTAGAVISGAYFGDKLSPMSDTTNLAPAMAGTDLFTHVRHMLWTTVPSWVISMVLYTIMGLRLDVQPMGGSVEEIHTLIQANFDPSWIHLMVPLITGALVLRKLPALPVLALATAMGAALAVIQGQPLGETLTAAMSGFSPDTGNAAVDELLARGGMKSMTSTILLILSAMFFGGVMERTGMLRTLALKVLSLAKSTGSLIASTVLTSIGFNVLAGDQYIAVVVPGRMYGPEYGARGLHAKNLSRALEDGGTITSPLIPWNTCGAYMSTTLGVATLAYLPFCFLNILNPIISMIYGFTGFSIAPAEPGTDPEK